MFNKMFSLKYDVINSNTLRDNSQIKFFCRVKYDVMDIVGKPKEF